MADKAVRISDKVLPISLASEWQLPALRWYQEAAIARWKHAGHRGVIALPTGSGKTVVALAAIARVGFSALVLVPTRVLLDQWSRALSAYWPHPVGKLGDGDHRVAPITISTYASAVAWVPRIGDRFGTVVVDEVHHVGGWCPSEVLEMLPAHARLGLTATPPGPGGVLEQRVGPIVYSLGVQDLVGDALAELDLVTVPIALGREERERYRKLRARFASVYAELARKHEGFFGWRDFVQAASKFDDGRRALEAWRGYRALLAYSEGKRAALREVLDRHAGTPTLIFTGDNATAYQIARELLVVPITHEIRRAEREQILARFRSKEISVLVSAQVLDEGFDVPDAEIAIVVGGTSSARRHIQRIGRVLRPREGKRALVYELAIEETTEVETVRRRRNELEAGGVS